MVTDIGKIQIRTQDLVLGLYIIFPRDSARRNITEKKSESRNVAAEDTNKGTDAFPPSGFPSRSGVCLLGTIGLTH